MGADRRYGRVRAAPGAGSLPGARPPSRLVGAPRVPGALLVACPPPAPPPTPRCGTRAPISSPGSRPDPIHTVAPIRCVCLRPHLREREGKPRARGPAASSGGPGAALGPRGGRCGGVHEKLRRALPSSSADSPRALFSQLGTPPSVGPGGDPEYQFLARSSTTVTSWLTSFDVKRMGGGQLTLYVANAGDIWTMRAVVGPAGRSRRGKACRSPPAPATTTRKTSSCTARTAE